MINTRKHLDILYNISMVLSVLSAIGTVICLIAWIDGEGALPFIICAFIAISSYLGAVLISVIIDFYDEIVTKHKTSNTTNVDATNPQK